MYHYLFLVCQGSFLLLTPALLLLRFLYRKPGWWLIVTLMLTIGWLLMVGAVMFYHESISAMIAAGKEPPEGWDRDGAQLVFSWYFGWAFSLIYSLPWLIIFFVATLFQKLKSRTTAPDTPQ
ncbi:MAG: hypothetical protein AAF353_07465 [Pseudomonadota bacterium]